MIAPFQMSVPRTMNDSAPVVEDLLRHPLQFGWYRVADAPVQYRALEVGRTRFGWTVAPYLRPRAAGAMLPQHYALTLRLSAHADWQVLEAKPFEWARDAERWARGLWRDAIDNLRRSGRAADGDEDGAAAAS